MEITANSLQVVLVNQNVQFTDTVISGSKCIKHRNGSGLITLRGITNQCNARYLVTFGGNLAANALAGAVSLAISLEGEPLSNTTMTVTPASTGEYFNVSAQTYIDVPKGCCATISVKNVSTQSVALQNANLTAVRVA